MSVKINKNGKEYPLGVIPQSLYDDVFDLKDDSGWQNLTTAYNIAKYRKKGLIVEIMIRVLNDSDIPSQTAVTVGTLPEGYRPSIVIYGTGNVGSTGNELAYIYVDTSGVVQIVNTSSSTQRYLFVNLTFIAG